jgi:hypothetical protein
LKSDVLSRCFPRSGYLAFRTTFPPMLLNSIEYLWFLKFLCGTAFDTTKVSKCGVAVSTSRMHDQSPSGLEVVHLNGMIADIPDYCGRRTETAINRLDWNKKQIAARLTSGRITGHL